MTHLQQQYTLMFHQIRELLLKYRHITSDFSSTSFGTAQQESVSIESVDKNAFAPLLWSLLLAIVPVQFFGAQVRYPWVYPGDFRERIRQADLVASGTIRSTLSGSTRVLDGITLTSNQASIQIDRVFKGQASKRTLHFLWFSPAAVEGTVIYSGPPIAKLVVGQRLMIFLRKDVGGYVVIMPVYEMEVPLAPASTLNIRDVAVLPDRIRDSEIAQELELAALSLGPPAPGTTGLAATYFPFVVDLIGGCAKPFLEHFAATPSKELRAAAQDWLTLLANKHMDCLASIMGDKSPNHSLTRH